MKNFKIVTLLFVIVALSSCDRVAPNYIGVLMEDYGKNGKADFTLQKGKVNTLAPGSELFQVPLFEQRGGFEEALHLKSADNTEFTAQPTYSYSVIEDRAVDVVFQNKQIGSGDEFMKALENNILEMKIRDVIKEESRRYPTDTLMASSGSLQFEQRVQELIKKEFLIKGLKLESFSAQLEFSAKVKGKIDQRNEVNSNVDVLERQIVEQRKKNELAALKAEENIILSRGITPQMLDQQAIEKWNGQLNGTYLSNNVPFIKSIK